MSLGKSLKNVSWKLENILKILKLSSYSIKFHSRQHIGNFWSYQYLAILRNFKNGAEMIELLLFGKLFADVSKIENCDAP